MTIGARLHHVERGRGMNVVLVHGFPLDLRMWDEQVAELSGSHRVIAVDLLGFGQSKSEEPFTIDRQAEVLHEYLKQIRALPCVLVGLSMGGYVALAFAQKCPMDLKRLALVDTKAEGDTAEQREGRGKMIELVRKEGSRGVAAQMMQKMIAPSTQEHRPAVVSKLRQIMEACPARTVESALAAMRDRPDRTELLASIAVPTLIVVGDSDAITPVAVAEGMEKAIPQAELVVIKGAGHMSPMEQPQQVNRALGGFLERVGEH